VFVGETIASGPPGAEAAIGSCCVAHGELYGPISATMWRFAA